MPAMHPAKALRASKIAAFASVSCAPIASSALLSKAQAFAWASARGLLLSNIATARCVHTAHWPSNPRENRIGAPSLPGNSGNKSARSASRRTRPDRLVSPRSERPVRPSALGQGARHVERLIAVERRHLDGDDTL